MQSEPSASGRIVQMIFLINKINFILSIDFIFYWNILFLFIFFTHSAFSEQLIARGRKTRKYSRICITPV